MTVAAILFLASVVALLASATLLALTKRLLGRVGALNDDTAALLARIEAKSREGSFVCESCGFAWAADELPAGWTFDPEDACFFCPSCQDDHDEPQAGAT